jgi:hypothetical protein
MPRSGTPTLTGGTPKAAAAEPAPKDAPEPPPEPEPKPEDAPAPDAPAAAAGGKGASADGIRLVHVRPDVAAALDLRFLTEVAAKASVRITVEVTSPETFLERLTGAGLEGVDIVALGPHDGEKDSLKGVRRERAFLERWIEERGGKVLFLYDAFNMNWKGGLMRRFGAIRGPDKDVAMKKMTKVEFSGDPAVLQGAFEVPASFPVEVTRGSLFFRGEPLIRGVGVDGEYVVLGDSVASIQVGHQRKLRGFEKGVLVNLVVALVG